MRLTGHLRHSRSHRAKIDALLDRGACLWEVRFRHPLPGRWLDEVLPSKSDVLAKLVVLPAGSKVVTGPTMVCDFGKTLKLLVEVPGQRPLKTLGRNVEVRVLERKAR